MTVSADPAVLWYRATTIEQMLQAQSAFADWPVVSFRDLAAAKRGPGRVSRLRDPALFPDPTHGCAVAMPTPVLHPAVLAALASATGVPEEQLRAVAIRLGMGVALEGI